MFNCENDNYYIKAADFSFAQIRSECNNVDIAARIYSCTIDDLIWPPIDSCGCPYCSCSSSNSKGTTYALNSYQNGGPRKECFNCTCSTPSSSTGITDIVYNCNELLRVDEPSEWNDFQCPPETCTDSSGYSQSAGTEWFEDVIDGEVCDEFCHCSPTQGKICATKFSNILADEVLSVALLDQCGYNAETKGVEYYQNAMYLKLYAFDILYSVLRYGYTIL